MKTKGKILQIIKWEDKESYFSNTDFGDKKVDLIHIAQLKDENACWWNTNLFYFWWSVFRDKCLKRTFKSIYKYTNFVFHSRMNSINDEMFVEGLPVLVDRPNDYKIGDIVEIDIKVKTCVM